MRIVTFFMLLATLAFGDCHKLPARVYSEMEKANPGLSVIRKSSEQACQAAGMCAHRMQVRPDGAAFVVECVTEEEWEIIAKDIIKQLPPEL